MQSIGGNTVVVFGSAAAPYRDVRDGAPRDIDVAHAGPWTDDTERLVREWAADRQLPEDLPIDRHQVNPDFHGFIRLPHPYDTPAWAFVLHGQAGVKWDRVTGLAAAIRAYRYDARELRAELDRLSRWTRLTVMYAQPERGWDDYVEGITALRAAVAKSAIFHEAVAGFPFQVLLDRLIVEDPRPTAESYGELLAASPAGGQGIILTLQVLPGRGGFDRRPRVYAGPDGRYALTPDEVIALLYP